MVSISFPVQDSFLNRIKNYTWVSWSEVAREEIRKKLIFEEYLKNRKISDDDWEFCERIDWHPVDELPLKKEFIKRLQKIRKGHFVRIKTLDELFK